MNKSGLCLEVASRKKLKKNVAEKIVDELFGTLDEAIKRGEHIEIRGFGSFSVRHYDSYLGRNPRTGEVISVKEKRMPFFKVGKELKSLVNK